MKWLITWAHKFSQRWFDFLSRAERTMILRKHTPGAGNRHLMSHKIERIQQRKLPPQHQLPKRSNYKWWWWNWPFSSFRSFCRWTRSMPTTTMIWIISSSQTIHGLHQDLMMYAHLVHLLIQWLIMVSWENEEMGRKNLLRRALGQLSQSQSIVYILFLKNNRIHSS